MTKFSSRLRDLPQRVHIAMALGLILLAIAPLGLLVQRTSRRQHDLELALLRSEAVLRGQWFGARASSELYAGAINIVRPPNLRRLDPGRTITPQDMFDAAEYARTCQCVPYFQPRYVFSTDFTPGGTKIVGIDADSTRTKWLESAIGRAVHDLPEDFDIVLLSELDPRTGSVVFISGGKTHPPNASGAFIYGFATDSSFVNLNALKSIGSNSARRATSDSAGIMRSIALEVRDERGTVVFQSGGSVDSAISARLQLGDIWGAWVIEASLLPNAAHAVLARGVPASPQSYLGVLLAVSMLLLLAAGLLMWRMIELARLRADFTSSISHELRTPLTQVLLYADMLDMGRAQSVKERQNALEIITRETRRLLHLVENILRFSRAERTGVTLDRKPISSLPLLEELLTTFEPLARSRGMELRLHSSVKPPGAILADEDAFRRIVLNLLDNAVKYGPPGQKVDVTLERRGSWLRLMVEDRGPGVPADARDRIFQPYERLRRGTGTGIGLTIVRQLVEAHDGRYGVEARVGGGATFFVDFLVVGGSVV